MVRHSGPALACEACGFLIPLADFLIWPDDRAARLAICPACAAVSTIRSAVPLVSTTSHSERNSGAVAACEVFVAETGSWLARCDCGATADVSSQNDGWSWMLAHDCTTTAAEEGRLN